MTDIDGRRADIAESQGPRTLAKVDVFQVSSVVAFGKTSDRIEARPAYQRAIERSGA